VALIEPGEESLFGLGVIFGVRKIRLGSEFDRDESCSAWGVVTGYFWDTGRWGTDHTLVIYFPSSTWTSDAIILPYASRRYLLYDLTKTTGAFD
jgi:hypothetical protein